MKVEALKAETTPQPAASSSKKDIKLAAEKKPKGLRGPQLRAYERGGPDAGGNCSI